ncbi:MAG: hypothetical protein QOC87_1055 [Actinomycetota bacterium]|nr:hypothetical protein [Actinomycetota bacterium]
MGHSIAARLIESLRDRFRGPAPKEAAGRYRISIGRTSRDVVVKGGGIRVDRIQGRPDVEIRCDLETWTAIEDGHISGIEAFANGRLNVRGSIDRSLWFETLFERPAAGAMHYDLERVSLGRTKISTLIAGPPDATPLVLLHGLGATKSSWLPIVPQLAREHRVYALDLPGFGSSSKPPGRYNAPWFAERVVSFMDKLGIENACVAGNSMGGRIAMEVAMTNPERVAAIACLCPATAFSYRPAAWLARLARPELGIAAARLPRQRVVAGLKELFADPKAVSPDWYDAAVDDFLTIWRSPSARIAFFASLRSIYLEEPYGEAGFWGRLSSMRTPALYLYGRKDHLITPRFGPKVAAALPSARVIVWDDCGHVPQIEHPDRTVDEMLGFFAFARGGLKADAAAI